MTETDTPEPAWASAPLLNAFLATVRRLTAAERLVIVEQAIAVLENFYVHLPLKRATRGVDPVRRAQALLQRLPRIGSDASFHHELSDIFALLHDFHTVYVLPHAFARRVAMLPFQIEQCFENDHPLWLVAHVARGFAAPAAFRPGAELLFWNGTPIARAVEAAARHSGGANPDAQLAQGLASMTLRPMVRMPPPEEAWVTIGYRGADRRAREWRCEWRVGRPLDETIHHPRSGLNLEADLRRRMRKTLYDTSGRRKPRVSGDAPARIPIASRWPEIFRAERLEFGEHHVGYIRIRTFMAPDDARLVREFVRLAGHVPPQGLIVDLRDNPGGLISAAERLLQVLSPNPIEPERAQLIATPWAQALCRKLPELRQWRNPTRHRTGAEFSTAQPLHSFAACNDLGQRYHGPVVLITNARCYSATDSFIAGFQDHGIGRIIGVDRNTGAGGATCWTHRQLATILHGRKSPLRRLPQGVDFRVALKRTLRVGPNAGDGIEELGTSPDILHRTTRRDLLEGNVDLLARAAQELKSQDWYKLDAKPIRRNGAPCGLRLSTTGIDRVDAFRVRADGTSNPRPLFSQPIAATDANTSVLTRKLHFTVRLEGYRSGKRVASRLLRIGD